MRYDIRLIRFLVNVCMRTIKDGMEWMGWDGMIPPVVVVVMVVVRADTCISCALDLSSVHDQYHCTPIINIIKDLIYHTMPYRRQYPDFLYFSYFNLILLILFGPYSLTFQYASGGA